MKKMNITWQDKVLKKSEPILTPTQKPKIEVALSIEPKMSKSYRKYLVRRQHREITDWLERETEKGFNGYTEIFEMEL